MEVAVNPVVVIGAGPQGLAAAAHLIERGLDPIVLESGDATASAVAEWGHVRLFSPWTELTDAASRHLLEPTGWSAPTQGYPTGAQWIEQYLAPLAEALGDRVRYGARVVGVGRKGRDLSVDDGRAEQPFVVHVERADGTEERIEASAVIDASGTWRTPSPAGADGLPALGESAATDAGLLEHRMPAIEDASALAGQHVVVVGNGHSAATTIGILSRVAKREPGTRITWVLRRGTVGNTFGGGSADELPERGALGQRAKKAVEDGLVDLVTGFRTEQVVISPPARRCWWQRTAAGSRLPLGSSSPPASVPTCPSSLRSVSTSTCACRPRRRSLRRSTRTCTPAAPSGPPARPTSSSPSRGSTSWERSPTAVRRRSSP